MFITYNGVIFDILTTNTHSMDAVRSDDGADYLYTRVHIDVTATLNPKAMSYPAPGQFPAETLVEIRGLLLQERAPLIITDVGGTVLQCPVPGYPCDAANGPFPRRCEITKVDADKTWIMRWACDCAIIECPLAGSSSGVISNRYSQSFVINRNHLATRTTIGVMKFRSDVLQQAGVFAHELFGQVPGASLPDSLPGFQREDIDVMVSSDGLTLNYRVTDHEKMYDKGEEGVNANPPGSGIIHLEGSAGVMSISSQEGIAAGSTMAHVYVRAHGNKYSNQWTMMQRCFQIVIAKIGLDPTQPPIGYITSAQLHESLGEDEKWVDVNISFMQFPVGQKATDGPGALRLDPMMTDVFDTMLDVFGDQSGKNPKFPNAYGTRGTAEVSVMTAALRQACQDSQATRQDELADGPFNSTDFNPPVPNINVQPAPNPIDREALYQGQVAFNEQVQATPTPYTHYRGSIEYEVIANTLMMPTTGPPPNSGGGGSQGTGDMGAPSGPGSPQWTWPAAVFSLGSPTAKMRVEFQAERIGQPPALPALRPNEPGGPNLVLSMYRIIPGMPEVWIDGSTLIYPVNGYYEFNMVLAPQDQAKLNLGVLPWTQLTFNDQYLSLSDATNGGSLLHGIYDPA